MNYHIIIQDKFFDCYIEDFYRIGQEKNNIILVRGNKGGSEVFKTSHDVEYLGPDNYEVLKNRLSILCSSDKLFISWYDLSIGRIISKLNIPCPIYVYLLGGEFYGEPQFYHEKWLLDPMTKKIYFHNTLYKNIFCKHKVWRSYRYISDFISYCNIMTKVKRDYIDKDKSLSKIDYIILTEHSDKEVDFVKSLYPSCHAKHLPGVFDQNFELAKKQELKSPSKDMLKIIFGHSADPTGNHIDGLNYIRTKLSIEYNLEVYSFLSYGDSNCRTWVLDYIKKNNINWFHPILEFLSRSKFVDFVNSMDILMMYHNRQQAEGNIMTALVLGKPVFIKPSNPQYDMLKRMGVKPVYDVTKMHMINLFDAIKTAQYYRNDTICRIEKEYSEAVRLKHLKNLIQS